MARKRHSGCRTCAGCIASVLAVLVLASALWLPKLMPTPSGPAQFVRFEVRSPMSKVLQRLESEGIVKDAGAASFFCRLTGRSFVVKRGTYRLKPGMSLAQVVTELHKPYRQMVRLPEGWWVARTAARLKENGVCDADAYREAAQDPRVLASIGVNTRSSSLEGFLYPDTYDLPPLTPAADVVALQLQTFKKKVLPIIPPKGDLDRLVTIASMVELEAAKDSERARIAGVIENRLAKGMPLEIDATVLYALQTWKVLTPGTVRTVKSPYNTYLHKGLPPGPIGSPSVKSIEAAIHPEKHGYLYYVARPDKSHYFSSTYEEHLKNIKRAREEWRQAGIQ